MQSISNERLRCWAAYTVTEMPEYSGKPCAGPQKIEGKEGADLVKVGKRNGSGGSKKSRSYMGELLSSVSQSCTMEKPC